MENIIRTFCNEHKSGLKLISMPTGAGKTYNANKYISLFLRNKNPESIKAIFYITPLKKNVDDTYNKLLKDFSITAEEDKHIIRLKSYAESIIENINRDDIDIPQDIINSREFRILQNAVKFYNEDKDLNDVQLTEIADKEIAFRKIIYRYLTKNIEGDINRNKKKNILLTDSKFKWLRELYPSMLVETKKVIYTTVDKFISYNECFYKKNYILMNGEIIKDSLVIIDEFDSTKNVILDRLIEDASNNRVDLIGLFSSIVSDLTFKKIQENLFAFDQDKRMFANMKKDLISYSDYLKLDYAFKLLNKKDHKSVILFDDFRTNTFSSADDGNRIYYVTNEKDQINEISISNKSNPESMSFYYCVNKVNSGLNTFINTMATMARDYYNKRRDSNAEDSLNFGLSNAINTVLSPFAAVKFNNGLIGSLVNSDINVPVSQHKFDYFESDFYKKGFVYYRFDDDLSHDTNTSVSMCYLYNTPEKIMVNLASKTRVIALSATSTLKSTIGNYNLNYLKKILGESFVEPNNLDLERIKQIIKSRKTNDYKINIKRIASHDNALSNFNKLIKNKKIRECFINTFITRFIENGTKDYDIKRFCKRMMPIKDFIHHKNRKALLLLCNENEASDSSKLYNKVIIYKLIETLCIESNIPISTFEICYLTGSKFNVEKEKYIKAMKLGKRAIIISSYQSAGTGQNLQFENNTLDEIDIGSVYIEYPTNILVNYNSVALNDKDLIKCIYQIESLVFNGELSSEDAKNCIYNAMQSISHNKPKHIINKVYTLPSVNLAILKTIMQGIGRICRSENKEKDVFIYFDEEIEEKVNLDYFDRRNLLMNVEFEKLIDFMKRKQASTISQNINLAETNNKIIGIKLNRLLSENANEWKERPMKQWNLTRKYLLKYPTIKREELDSIIKNNESDFSFLSFDAFYLFGNNSKLNKYYIYDFNEKDKEFNSIKISYDVLNGKNCIEISEKSTRLFYFMQLKQIKNYFEKNGYATEFKNKDAVLLPVVMQNLYKGALGEIVGKLLLEDIIKDTITEIDDVSKFEKFDYSLNNDLYIDFKNWSTNFKMEKDWYVKKTLNKLNQIKARKAVVINIVSDEFIIDKYDNGRLIVISGLCLFNEEKCIELNNSQKEAIREVFYGNN